MTNALRVAVIGTGMIGAVHVRSARVAGAEVVGVAASTAERSAEAARGWGVPRGYASAEQAAADPDVDVVHVCTPNHLHTTLSAIALESGHHVVCEKPVATSLADATALQAAARRSGRVVAVPFVYRYHPLVRQSRALVRGGRLGEVRLVHGHYLQDWLMGSTDSNWRVDAARGGVSRAFADIGSHWWDLAEFVTGQELRAVSALRRTFVGHRPAGDRVTFAAGPAEDEPLLPVTTEDAVVVTLAGEGGTVGSVVVSQVSPGRKNRLWLEVDAADGSVVFDQEDPERLWVGGRAEARVVPRDPAVLDADAARLCVVPAGHPQGYLECFDAFVADAYDAMRGGRPEGLPTVDDGVRAVALTDTVIRQCLRAESEEAQ